VVLRHRQERHRLVALRRLIRKLERLQLASALPTLRSRPRSLLHLHDWNWRGELRAVLADRARTLTNALHHATGVYFPNRAHKVRVAAKRLRYSVEIAESTGALPSTQRTRDLRKAQDELGEIHDRQVLLDELERDEGSWPVGVEPQHVETIRVLLDTECRDFHARHLKRRERLFAVAAEILREAAHPHPRVRVSVAAGALAMSSVLYAWRHRSALKSPEAICS
jgi:CHAD domain-containing protein